MVKSNQLLTALTLTLLLNLFGIIFTADLSLASPEAARWSRVNIPTEGKTGNWVLANGSNVRHPTMAVDGTIYGYANPSATSYRLFKSTDAGNSWTTIGMVTDTIIDIATSPDDANIIYYATTANIYKSTNAGNSFTPLPLSPGGAGSDNITVTSIDVSRLDSNHIIAIGTRDSDVAQYGGVYILNENEPFTGWINTNIGSYDVSAVVFSPNFATDWQLVAVVTNEQDTLVTTKMGNSDWGKVVGDATINSLTAISAAIAFPDDYDATIEGYTLFVALDTGSNNGDVYMVNGIRAPDSSIALDLNIGAAYNLSNTDVTSLAVNGNTKTASLLAGTANSTQVYISTDSGINWTRSRQKPTGQSKTYLLMAPDFASRGIAYAATAGTESAFSYTTDGGVTWNQTGLIDTAISDIRDLALSPNYSQDTTLFMLTFDGAHTEHSLWRSLTDGAKWERVFSKTLADADSLNLVGLSPQYGSNSQTVFLTGSSGGNAAIWKSSDKGQTFLRRSVPFSIDTWKVVNDNILLLGSYDGSNGLVYRTTNSGLSYSSPVVTGSYPIQSITLSPNYEQDKTILVANNNGWVYWSKDDGTSFEPLPPDASSAPLTGTITVSFDPEFSSNDTIYAVSSTADKGIYRFIINKSTVWQRIDSTLPTGGMLNQPAVAADGTLYATNSQQVDTSNDEGGMERSLNPKYSLGPTFETVTRGLEDGSKLSGLWLQDSQLWAIDTVNARLMTYIESLAQPVTLTSPPDQTPGTGTVNTRLEWETLKGATEYKWQLDYDTDFSTVPSGFEGDTKASSARLPALEKATTYYWRVRATKPVPSKWSAKWSFTTSLSTIISPLQLHSPKAGANNVTVKPVFQWSSIDGADSYELLVSTDASFINPTIVKIGEYALPANAWQSNSNLDYATTYYWKVRASSSNSHSTWSAIGAFTTESPPPEPITAPEQSLPAATPLPQTPSPQLSPPFLPTPLPVQSTLPDWAIYLTGSLLFIIVLLLITLLVIVVRIRQP